MSTEHSHSIRLKAPHCLTCHDVYRITKKLMQSKMFPGALFEPELTHPGGILIGTVPVPHFARDKPGNVYRIVQFNRTHGWDRHGVVYATAAWKNSSKKICLFDSKIVSIDCIAIGIDAEWTRDQITAIKSALVDTGVFKRLSHERSPKEMVTARIIDAVHVAAEAHTDHCRSDRDETPYINHRILVAHILTHICKVDDQDIVIAALLRHAVKDAFISPDDVEKLFGDRVRRIIAACLDSDESVPADESKKRQIMRAPHMSIEARLIELADELANLRYMLAESFEACDQQYVTGYFVWAYALVAALSNTNARIEKEFERVFAGTFNTAAHDIPVLPDPEKREDALEAFYAHLARDQ